MSSRIDHRETIAAALKGLGSGPFADASLRLFSTLGYTSERRIPIATPTQFREQLDPHEKLTDRERETLDQVKSLHFLFQIADAELSVHADMFEDAHAVQPTKIESYLFFAAELPAGKYTRTALSALVRAVNKPLPMPALVLFRHGDTVSLGIIHRRLHKRDQARDVLEKVTLIKDVAFVDPIRAHLEILNDFVLENLNADFGVANFVGLHDAWQRRLGSYALSNDFYREIADWYFWAHHHIEDGRVRLPQHCDTEQEESLFLIRLLTRVIFCWFLVEKRLIPADLFRVHRLKSLLKEFNPSNDPGRPDGASSYYRAVLQNLFFGTLNLPSNQRAFRENGDGGARYLKKHVLTNLWQYETEFRDPATWLTMCAHVPFLNGGLFDCLDDRIGKQNDNYILDGFSESPELTCHLPNDLFFGAERVVDLSRDYGEESKRTARSKKAKVRGLIEILSRYKFTIEENTPLEEEIALDPELLGKVFENLLASFNKDTQTTARKALGAFYTPREIVSYMVDEALKSYLGNQVPRCKGALDDLFSNKATLRDIRPDAREALIAAIGRVRILDPACGSGAFPMGALHRLVDLLQKLDPSNESWKRDRLKEGRQHRQVLVEARAAMEEIAACDARIEDIKKSFDPHFHDLDFARKLYLIENSIYGVDIQPIATQIAKLRFFIALIVDQKVDLRAENLGVRPLPNLETRIVAADALIPIGEVEGDLFSDELDKLRAELASIRHGHFNALSPESKRKWREADEAKRGEIAVFLENSHALSHASARQLATWDPYDQNAFAPFFDSEWMFGLPIGRVDMRRTSPATLAANLESGNEEKAQANSGLSKVSEVESGFDIVIGNPPYVRPHKLSSEYKDLLWQCSKVFEKKADLYSCFIEKGVNLLKPSGRLAFIVSNGFLRLDSFEKLRRFLLDKTAIEVIIDFSDDVFQSAAVKTCIIILARDDGSKEAHQVRASVLSRVEELSKPAMSSIAQAAFSGKYKAIFDLSTNVRVDAVKLRMELGSVRLGDRFEVQFGLKTGDDEKFLGRDALTRDHKRLLRGENVGRYVCRFAGEYVWYVPDRMIAHRRTARPGTRDRFEQPKVLVRDTGQGLMGTFDDENYYVKDVLVVTDREKSRSSLKTLLGLLNSTALRFYYETSFPTLHVQRGELASLPLPETIVELGSESLVRLVDIVLFLNEQLPFDVNARNSRDPLMLAYWERVLNGLVYELYFPEEVHGAGLHLFDVFGDAQVADPNNGPESSRLKVLRASFERLYDGTHPLRIALDKLQTLDTIRIIEGKS